VISLGLNVWHMRSGPTMWTFHFLKWSRRNEEPAPPQHLDHSLGCLLLWGQGSCFSCNFVIFWFLKALR
jgi:hypothetical protein